MSNESASPSTPVPPRPGSTIPEVTPEVAQVYAMFSTLSAMAKEHFQGELGGKLLLYRQLNPQGSAVALAGNIAGAATLGIDDDIERLKQGVRHGFCDFLVNNLDESLRILKNEIRKKQPVSVCLQADFAAMLCEIVDRGVQPDLLAFPVSAGELDNYASLMDRGALLLPVNRIPKSEQTEITWTASKASALWLPKVDSLAAQVLPSGDERRRWLRLAPRYLGRSMTGQRYLRMSTREADRFSVLLDEARVAETIGAEIVITR